MQHAARPFGGLAKHRASALFMDHAAETMDPFGGLGPQVLRSTHVIRADRSLVYNIRKQTNMQRIIREDPFGGLGP
jgi:hypothetical protein